MIKDRIGNVYGKLTVLQIYNLLEWSKISSIPYSVRLARLGELGWDVDRTITTQVRFGGDIID